MGTRQIIRRMHLVTSAGRLAPQVASEIIGLDTDQEQSCPAKPIPRASPYADIAPALVDYSERVLFGDVWQRPGLSPRDRSLITVAALVALYRTNEIPVHLNRALDNGVTREELVELITHLAFYSGWPTANTAMSIAKRVFDEDTR